MNKSNKLLRFSIAFFWEIINFSVLEFFRGKNQNLIRFSFEVFFQIESFSRAVSQLWRIDAAKKKENLLFLLGRFVPFPPPLISLSLSLLFLVFLPFLFPRLLPIFIFSSHGEKYSLSEVALFVGVEIYFFFNSLFLPFFYCVSSLLKRDFHRIKNSYGRLA